MPSSALAEESLLRLYRVFYPGESKRHDAEPVRIVPEQAGSPHGSVTLLALRVVGVRFHGGSSRNNRWVKQAFLCLDCFGDFDGLFDLHWIRDFQRRWLWVHERNGRRGLKVVV